MPLCTDFTDPRLMQGLTGLVFDCDGVLFDSWEVNKAYYNAIREGLGLEPMDAQMEEYVHAHAVNESVIRITPEGRLAEAQAVRAGLDYRELIHLMLPAPGLVPMLEAARDAGLRLGVFTNRSSTMELVLETFGLEHFFDPVVTARDVKPKPAPDGLRRILNRWRATSAQVAFVGDTILDQRAARGAGVRFWAYRAEALRADMHVDDFWCLGRRLASLGRGPAHGRSRMPGGNFP
jgi:HAD superfamily hydrolase (TIGR01549 family)